MVIVNLQRTPIDGRAGLIIHAKCDDVMTMLLKHLEIDIPMYHRYYNIIIIFDLFLRYEEEKEGLKRSILEFVEDGPSKRVKTES